MKQVVQNLKDGSIHVVDVPVPSVDSGFVLVQAAASVVSAGTERAAVEFGRLSLLEKARAKPHLVRQVWEKTLRDGPIATVRAVLNRLDSVNTLGYACAGTVVEVGSGVTSVAPGDLVACGGAGYASHAEYVTVPEHLVARMPCDEPGLLEDASFTTLGAIALHGVRNGGVRIGEVVAVIGLGLLGQITVQLLKVAGCVVIGIDLEPKRVELAQRCGIDAAHSERAAFVESCLQRTMGRGADVTLVTAATPGNEPIEMAGDATRDKGRVVAVGDVGLQVPRRVYYQKEIELVVSRSYGPGRYDAEYEERGHDYPYAYVRWTEQRNMQTFLDFVVRRVVQMGPLVTHRFWVEDAAAAYELIAERGSESFLGVVIKYREAAAPTRSFEMPPPNAKPRMSRVVDRVGLGVVGAGAFVTSVLLPAFQQTGFTNFISVANRSGVTAREAARRFGFRYVASDAKEVFANPAVSLVVIGTPHNLHAELTATALAGGKDVFVEKPLCLTLDDFESVRAALKASPERKLMVGFNRRFAPLAIKLAEALRDRPEPLVVHYRVNAGYIQPDHWIQDPTVGGGRLLGEGCHFLDFMIWLARTRVEEVTTWSMTDAGRYRRDNVVVQLRFMDGSLGTLTYVSNGSRQSGKERVEVYCAGQSAILDDFRRLEMARPGRLRLAKTRTWSVDKGHLEECRLTVEAVRRGTDVPIPLTDTLHSTFVTLMAHESLRRRAPISVSGEDD